jgi:hypothetical protein
MRKEIDVVESKINSFLSKRNILCIYHFFLLLAVGETGEEGNR